MNTDKLIVAGMMPNENWFNSARVVYKVDGVAPCLTSMGGGGNNTLTKIMEIRYELEMERSDNLSV